MASVIRGGLGLSLAMGIGRFFYTPVLPLMIAALGWSGGAAGWVATANYLGYLVGSVALARGWMRPGQVIYRGSLIASTALLALVALSPALPWQLVVRFGAGVASAIIFVCITQTVANAPAGSSSGRVYCGVGAGIGISGLVVWAFGPILDWRSLWLLAAVVSALFSLIAWGWRVDVTHGPAAGAAASSRTGAAVADAEPVGGPATEAGRSAGARADGARARSRGGLLTVGYFFEGFGYIIIGTYLVVLAGPVFGASAAALTWLVAGLGAIVSPMVWSWAAGRFGRGRALIAVYGLQLIGAIAGAVGGSAILLFLSAFLFGGTFIGITMLTIATATHGGMANASARLTSWYSIGQVAGPALVALVLGDRVVASFVVAAVAVALAMVATIAARVRPA